MTRFGELTAEERLLMRSEVRLAALDPGAVERVRSAWNALYYPPPGRRRRRRGPSWHDAFAAAVRAALRQPKGEGG